jgi:hypothetical protein
MTKLYILTRYLTFPGAFVRCLWEQIICRIHGIPMEDTRLLRRDELCSHIEHELCPKAGGAFAIGFVPALFNAILAFLLALGPLLGVFVFRMNNPIVTVLQIVAYWFAFSLYVNSYPSVEDALNMKEKIYREGNILQKILFLPGFVGCYIGAFLERYCITFLLALAVMIAMLVRF